MIYRWLPLAIALLLSIMCGSADAAGDDSIKIEEAAPTVEYKHFDPANPPDPAPPIAPGEAAVCVYNYGIEVDSRYTAKSPPGNKSPVTVDVKLERVSVKLTLTVTIWLPHSASKALTAHEEGHRTIAQTFYDDAERSARDVASRYVDKTTRAQGKDVQSTGQSVLDKLNQKICDDYLAVMNTPCGKAQEAFDRITDHGRKNPPSTKEAVPLALKEARK